MKKLEHRLEAERIGADSWNLLNWSRLPRNANTRRQIEALRRDKKWLEDHINNIGCRIDALIRDIEKSNAKGDSR